MSSGSDRHAKVLKNNRKRNYADADFQVTKLEAEFMSQMQKKFKAGLTNNSMTDLELMGDDGVPVHAVRFIMGCASPVFEKMLYGSFREGNKDHKVVIQGVNSKTLEILVEFCCTGKLNATFLLSSITLSDKVRNIAELAMLGHQYQIDGIEECVCDFLKTLFHENPSTTCIAFNHAHVDKTPKIYSATIKVLQRHPYAALMSSDAEDSTTGIVSLTPEKLEELLSNQSILAEEIFLFEKIVEWYAHNQHNVPECLQVAKKAANLINLQLIDPEDLKIKVVKSGLVPAERLMEAFMEQAIAASKHGIKTFRGCRGMQGKKKNYVIVHGAVVPEHNGIYIEHDCKGGSRSFTCRFNHGKKFIILLMKGERFGWWIFKGEGDNKEIYMTTCLLLSQNGTAFRKEWIVYDPSAGPSSVPNFLYIKNTD